MTRPECSRVLATPESDAAMPARSPEIEGHVTQRVSGRVRGLKVSTLGRKLILEGTSGSYYGKQLATHAALEIVGSLELVNLIAVASPRQWT